MTGNFQRPRNWSRNAWQVDGPEIDRQTIDQITALVNPTGKSQHITEIHITAENLEVTRLEPGHGFVTENRKIR